MKKIKKNRKLQTADLTDGGRVTVKQTAYAGLRSHGLKITTVTIEAAIVNAKLVAELNAINIDGRGLDLIVDAASIYEASTADYRAAAAIYEIVNRY